MGRDDEQDGLIDVRHRIARSRFELSALKLAEKAGFHPDQPRIPAGNSDGGQWSDTGTGSGTTSEQAGRRVFDGQDGTRITAQGRRNEPD